MEPAKWKLRRSRRLGARAAAAGRCQAEPNTGVFESLPAPLLELVGRALLVSAEHEVLTVATRCRFCRMHRSLRCTCDDGETTEKRRVRELVHDCEMGIYRPLLVTKDVIAYRSVLLRAIHTLRMVCRHWYRSVEYTAIDNLRFNDADIHSTAPPAPRGFGQRKGASKPLCLPMDFAVRFSGCVTLDFGGCCLGALPVQLREMKSLRHLCLDGQNFLSELPDWLETLPIVELRLRCGHVPVRLADSDQFEYYPEEASKMYISNPTEKDLAFSRALYGANKNFCAWICSQRARFPKTLKWLSIEDFNIEMVPPCVRRLTNLESLDISYDPFILAAQSPCKFSLPPWISELKRLKQFNHCAARADAASAEILAGMTLEQLDIHENDWFNLLPRMFAPRGSGSLTATLVMGVKVIKCPSPLNVLKDTCDHSCYLAR
jgi:hypothetical protein